MVSNISIILRHPLNHGRAISSIFRYLKWQFLSRIMKGPIIVSWIDDKRMIVRRGMHGATGNIYCGLHEYQEMGFLLHFLKEGDLFVDVGANVGTYSILASAAGADIIAYEPGERFADLVANMRINNIDADCRKAAVGSSVGMVRFTVGLDSMNHISRGGEPTVEVGQVTLDADLRRIPTLVKIDVEGFEKHVFAGGAKILASAKAIIAELGADRKEIFEMLGNWGFRQIDYDAVTRRIGPPTVRVNTIWVREDPTARLEAAPVHYVNGLYF